MNPPTYANLLLRAAYTRSEFGIFISLPFLINGQLVFADFPAWSGYQWWQGVEVAKLMQQGKLKINGDDATPG